MKRTSPTLLSALALAAFAAAPLLAGCTEETIPANALLALKSPTGTGSHAPLAFSVVSPYWDRLPEPLYLRLNGQDVYINRGGDDDKPTREALLGSGGATFFYVPGGEYVVELVDSQDQVLLQTSSLTVANKRLNSLAVYGDKPTLSYLYRAEDPNAVPQDKIRVHTANLALDREPAKFSLCKGFLTELTDCRVVEPALPYGAPLTIDVDGEGEQYTIVQSYADYEMLNPIARDGVSGPNQKMLLHYQWRIDCAQLELPPANGVCSSNAALEGGLFLRD